MSTLHAPGWAESVRRQTLVRDCSLLGVDREIAGYPVKAMTLLDYLRLRTIGNPLVFRSIPSPIELASFLWLLSPWHGRDPLGIHRLLHFRRCREFVAPSPPLIKTRASIKRWTRACDKALCRGAEVVQAAQEYIAEAFMDKPRGGSSGGQLEYYSDGVGWCAFMGRTYGFPPEVTLRLPITALFQFLNEAGEREGRPLRNPSDDVINKAMRALKAERKAKIQQ